MDRGREATPSYDTAGLGWVVVADGAGRLPVVAEGPPVSLGTYVVDSVVPRRPDRLGCATIDVFNIKALHGVPWSDAAMHDPSQRFSAFEVSLVPEPPFLFLGLRGELDVCGATEMPQDDYASRPDLTTVLVDLGELTFCDVTGLRALLTFSAIHEAQGRSVSVVRANRFIVRLMRLCGVTDRLEFARPANATLV